MLGSDIKNILLLSSSVPLSTGRLLSEDKRQVIAMSTVTSDPQSLTGDADNSSASTTKETQKDLNEPNGLENAQHGDAANDNDADAANDNNAGNSPNDDDDDGGGDSGGSEPEQADGAEESEELGQVVIKPHEVNVYSSSSIYFCFINHSLGVRYYLSLDIMENLVI